METYQRLCDRFPDLGLAWETYYRFIPGYYPGIHVEQLSKKEPFILRQAASDWPCVKKWSMEMFSDMDRKVVISTSIEEREPSKKKIMKIKDFIGSMSDHKEGFSYLKEVDLEKFDKQLTEDTRFDLYTSSGSSYLWIGTSRCTTGAHTDDEDNWVTQVKGHKLFLFLPPDTKLTPNNKYDIGTRCFDADLKNYQKYSPYVAILEPGDILYFPKYWIHQVHSLDDSITVNHFTSTWSEWIIGSIRRRFYDFLHNWFGMWKDNCVCHAT